MRNMSRVTCGRSAALGLAILLCPRLLGAQASCDSLRGSSGGRFQLPIVDPDAVAFVRRTLQQFPQDRVTVGGMDSETIRVAGVIKDSLRIAAPDILLTIIGTEDSSAGGQSSREAAAAVYAVLGYPSTPLESMLLVEREPELVVRLAGAFEALTVLEEPSKRVSTARAIYACELSRRFLTSRRLAPPELVRVKMVIHYLQDESRNGSEAATQVLQMTEIRMAARRLNNEGVLRSN